jgi:hypothetical protein
VQDQGGHALLVPHARADDRAGHSSLSVSMWYLSRQLAGGGMQAFSFGRSMARLVNPEDSVTEGDLSMMSPVRKRRRKSSWKSSTS